MKFISGIKKEDVNDSISLKIPMYHRTSISFFNGSEVYYINRSFPSNNFQIRELILTPIIPAGWHHIRKVTINSIDSPGIINTITTKLRDLKINVNIEEALATQVGAIHTITLLIDLSYYVHAFKINMGDKIPEAAINRIETELLSLKNPRNGEPIVTDGQISIKELTFLESISNVPGNFEISNISDDQFSQCTNQKIKNENGRIILSKQMINDLGLNETDSFYYTMFSDTEEKYLKILFFDPGQTVAFIDIHHQDVYGAISKFTDIIFSEHNFNILASYSHQQMQKVRAHWYALVDISHKEQKFFQEILPALKHATYGDALPKKKVLDVFLVETNTEKISNSTIISYGQNRRTKDGDQTSVHCRKRNLLKQLVEDFGIENYKAKPLEFIRSHEMHRASSVKTFIDSILKEKQSTQKTRRKRYILWAISILIPVAVLSVLVITVPSIKELLEAAIHHSVAVGLVLVALGSVYFIKNILEKKLEKLERR